MKVFVDSKELDTAEMQATGGSDRERERADQRE